MIQSIYEDAYDDGFSAGLEFAANGNRGAIAHFLNFNNSLKTENEQLKIEVDKLRQELCDIYNSDINSIWSLIDDTIIKWRKDTKAKIIKSLQRSED